MQGGIVESGWGEENKYHTSRERGKSLIIILLSHCEFSHCLNVC